jgi:acylphosphatase
VIAENDYPTTCELQTEKSGSRDMIARRFLVSGRVQGVFFRASTRKEAERLGLRGSAVNLPDGRVEVLAVGPQLAMDQLGDWLRSGPALARVTGVLTQPLETSEITASGFDCG